MTCLGWRGGGSGNGRRRAEGEARKHTSFLILHVFSTYHILSSSEDKILLILGNNWRTRKSSLSLIVWYWISEFCGTDKSNDRAIFFPNGHWRPLVILSPASRLWVGSTLHPYGIFQGDGGDQRIYTLWPGNWARESSCHKKEACYSITKLLLRHFAGGGGGGAVREEMQN